LLNAAAELPAGDPGRDAVRRHKEEVQELLAGHVSGLLPEREEQVPAIAAHLAFLLEGAMARAGLEGNDGPLKEARRMAGQLLDALRASSATTPRPNGGGQCPWRLPPSSGAPPGPQPPSPPT
jgi:hypothetical protein